MSSTNADTPCLVPNTRAYSVGNNATSGEMYEIICFLFSYLFMGHKPSTRKQLAILVGLVAKTSLPDSASVIRVEGSDLLLLDSKCTRQQRVPFRIRGNELTATGH